MKWLETSKYRTYEVIHQNKATKSISLSITKNPNYQKSLRVSAIVANEFIYQSILMGTMIYTMKPLMHSFFIFGNMYESIKNNLQNPRSLKSLQFGLYLSFPMKTYKDSVRVTKVIKKKSCRKKSIGNLDLPCLTFSEHHDLVPYSIHQRCHCGESQVLI